MRRTLCFLILAATTSGLAGCKTDQGSTASSQMAEGSGPPARTREAPSPEAPNPVNNRTPTPTRTPTPNKDSRPLVVCFGDSLTAGAGASDGASYPDFLQADLDRDGYSYRVVNQGVSGDTTKDGLDRLADVTALHPAVVVLEFGGNDGLRGFKVDTTRDNLASMIQTLQTGGSKVILAGITLPPDYGPDYINRFTSNYPTLAKRYHTPLLPFLLKDVYGVPGLMQRDRTHATDKGNAVVAHNVLPLVEHELKK